MLKRKKKERKFNVLISIWISILFWTYVVFPICTRGSCDRDLHGLKQWAQEKLISLSEDKRKFLHLECGNPHRQYKLGDKRIEDSPTEKYLGVLVDGKMYVSLQCAFAAQKASCILVCIKRNIASGSREVILSFFFVLMRSHLEYCVHI